MSDFKFSCPHCDQHIACDQSYYGVQINCPTCSASIKVPMGYKPAPSPSSNVAGPTLAQSAPVRTALRGALPMGFQRKLHSPSTPRGKSGFTTGRAPVSSMDAISKDKSMSFREKLSAKFGAPQPKWFWGVAGLLFLLSLVGLAEPSGIAFLVFFIILFLLGLAIWLMHAVDAFRNSSLRRGLFVLLLPGYLGRYVHKHCTNLLLRRLVSAEALGVLLIIVTGNMKSFDGTIFNHQDSESDSERMTTRAEAGFASPKTSSRR